MNCPHCSSDQHSVNVTCANCGVIYKALPNWVGLTEDERRHARETVTYRRLAMTAAEWTEEVQKETERRLKDKNT